MNHTKVVLVGDHRQLPEINAGGAFAALASDLGAVALHRNRRQREPWEGEALDALRDADPDRAVELYLAAGRVGVTDDLDTAHQHLIRDWWAARAAGDEVVMLASRRAPVDVLNRLARQHLRDHGLLRPRPAPRRRPGLRCRRHRHRRPQRLPPATAQRHPWHCDPGRHQGSDRDRGHGRR
jgi:ATP-dependent exoDNAse (exonuclease V) alpha subunit